MYIICVEPNNYWIIVVPNVFTVLAVTIHVVNIIVDFGLLCLLMKNNVWVRGDLNAKHVALSSSLVILSASVLTCVSHYALSACVLSIAVVIALMSLPLSLPCTAVATTATHYHHHRHQSKSPSTAPLPRSPQSSTSWLVIGNGILGNTFATSTITVATITTTTSSSASSPSP